MKIKQHILKIIFIVCRFFGMNRGQRIILCYHGIDSENKYSVPKDVFIQQIKHIKKNFVFVSLDDLLSKKNNSEKNYAALTFDDGYKSILSVKHFLEKEKIHPALFVISKSPHVNRAELEHNGKILSWTQIRTLQKEGWIIGCHSATHSDFSSMTKMELTHEIITAKKDLEKQIQKNVDYFAYPKGFVSNTSIDLVKKAGFSAAFSTVPAQYESKNMHRIPRYVVEKTYSPSDFPINLAQSTLMIRSIIDRLQIL